MAEIWKKDGFFIGDDDYVQRMKGEVEPFVKDHVVHDFLQARDGLKLSYYYALQEGAKGTVVIAHGFCEFFDKLSEMVYYYYRAGFNVFFLECRGHGESARPLPDADPDMVWVKSFDDFVWDYDDFVRQVVLKKSPVRPLMAFGHSMGGCIVARTLEEDPDLFDRAVLSSPMMSLGWGGLPMIAVHAAVFWAVIRGKMATYLPGQHGFDNVPTFPECSMKSRVRYDHMFSCRQEQKGAQVYGGSYAWGKASLSGMKTCVKKAPLVKTETLMLTAGKDNMVTPDGQEAFLRRCSCCRRKNFPESRHEIYNAYPEERAEYYDDILSFFSAPL